MPILTDATLAGHVAAQAERAARPARGAAARVHRGLADAEAHALKALTDTLRATPDGRATLARARRNPSCNAALARLDELQADLAGLVKDARRAAYADCYAFWRAHLPAEFRRHEGLDSEPRKADIERVAVAVLHGQTVERWLAGPFVTARRGLDAKLAQAASRGMDDASGRDLLKAWAAQAERAVAANVATAMVDGATFADRAAGRDVARPELLHDDPTLPS